MPLFLSAIHGFAPTTDTLRGLDPRVGRAPAQANRIGPGPYGLGTCVRQGPAARSSAVRNLGPLSIKFRLLTARLFIKPERHKLNMQNLINGMHARTGLPRASCAASPNTHGANSSSTAGHCTVPEMWPNG